MASLNTETMFQWVEKLTFCKGGEKFRGLPFSRSLATLHGTLYKMHKLEKERIILKQSQLGFTLLGATKV